MERATLEQETPTENLPCLWALAGVLNYRLCDLEYRCEECDLFRALSRPRPGPAHLSGGTVDYGCPGATPNAVLEEQVGAHLSYLLKGCRLYLDRWYSPGHYWLSFEPGVEATLGLHAHIPRILRPVDEISTPKTGTRLNRGDPSGWIARSVLAIPLRTPIAGTVTAVNEEYLDAVRTSGSAPAPVDWLVRMDVTRPLDMDPSLLRGERTLAWYLEVIGTISRYLREALSGPAFQEVGRTLSDGGGPENDLELVLGPEGFARLVSEVL